METIRLNHSSVERMIDNPELSEKLLTDLENAYGSLGEDPAVVARTFAEVGVLESGHQTYGHHIRTLEAMIEIFRQARAQLETGSQAIAGERVHLVNLATYINRGSDSETELVDRRVYALAQPIPVVAIQ